MPTINLLGPNPAQGMDLQTQQLQLAQAQQIAQALIGQGITGNDSPVIHTAPGNPFARDVANWSGPLSKAIMGAVGLHRQGTLNEQQQALAQAIIGQREEGMATMAEASRHIPAQFGTVLGDQGGPGDALSNPTPDRSIMTHPGQEGGILAGAMAGLNARSPEARAIAQMFLKMQADISKEQMVKPADMSSLGKEYDPTSFPRAMTRDPLTNALILSNPKALERIPTPVTTPLGDTTNFPVTAGATKGTGSVPSITNQPPGILLKPGAVSPDGKTKNDTPYTMAYNYRTGELSSADKEDPKFKTQAAAADDFAKLLQTGHQGYQKQVATLPTLVKLEALTRNLATGAGGSALTDVRRWMKTMGISEDEQGKIVDAQSWVKYLTGPATQAIHDVSSRPAVLEFSQLMQSSAADLQADPRTAVNILHKLTVEGLNSMESHLENVNTAGRMSAFSGGTHELYRPQMTTEQMVAALGEQYSAQKMSLPPLTKNPLTNRWLDEGLGSEASHQNPGSSRTPETVDLRKKYKLP